MVNNIVVLYNGYSRMCPDDPNVMYANCTCTLIKSQQHNIIIDTMSAWNGKDILDGMSLVHNNLQ